MNTATKINLVWSCRKDGGQQGSHTECYIVTL